MLSWILGSPYAARTYVRLLFELCQHLSDEYIATQENHYYGHMTKEQDGSCEAPRILCGRGIRGTHMFQLGSTLSCPSYLMVTKM